MTFATASRSKMQSIKSALAVMAGLAFAVPAWAGDLGFAIVPTQIIYPGEEIDASKIQSVPVTNPKLMGGYAKAMDEVRGMVTTRTLLPGRTIMVSSLRQPYTLKRGDKIVLVYDQGGLRITAAGTPLADAITGEFIKVRNTDTGVIISGTVMQDGTVLVEQK
ncbi:flagellar basal body P-ring formation chaperone FlgA [Rhizobium alvei]|uniref:Flagella basal body P-ring formation protein FlgA n=1 Tax=Rhizobium alvei TaxID=1132659 RepID=A0ABT8YFV7_9HYPH|nr:flagellar basal body P-ring formation chaperone FlgA [Rhizobium alvei]MDO6962562.1 flagellar basal body P-ring formation chaperone FlgA [Rhizobium alvei]